MFDSTNLPHEKTLDSSIDLMREGYLFIKNRIDKYHSDFFKIRLMAQSVICISGREATEIFYDSERFLRKGVAPKQLQKTVFGENAIQTMDGEAHLYRKRFFLSLMTKEQAKNLADLAMVQWLSCITKWDGVENIVLFDEAKFILCRIACQWANIPLEEMEEKERANDFIAMVNSFHVSGVKYLKGKSARIKTEDWIRKFIEDTRSGKLTPSEDSPLYAMAFYKEPEGNLLDAQMAAAELINIILPIVSISIYITFAALALQQHPEYKEKLTPDNDKLFDGFVKEIQRYYPFVPFIGAKVRKAFTWKGCKFKQGTLVLLDLYGTNHDSRIWENPNEFRPERFMEKKPDLFEFIPEGGGNPFKTHRSPGEEIVAEIMKVSLDFLVNKIQYEIPVQNFNFSFNKIPTLPESGFIIKNVIKKC